MTSAQPEKHLGVATLHQPQFRRSRSERKSQSYFQTVDWENGWSCGRSSAALGIPRCFPQMSWRRWLRRGRSCWMCECKDRWIFIFWSSLLLCNLGISERWLKWINTDTILHLLLKSSRMTHTRLPKSRFAQGAKPSTVLMSLSTHASVHNDNNMSMK